MCQILYTYIFIFFFWGNLCYICNVCYHCMIYIILIYRCDLKKNIGLLELVGGGGNTWNICCYMNGIFYSDSDSRSGGVGGRWRQGAEVGQPLQTTAPLHFMFYRIIYTWCIFIHLVYNIHLLFLYTSCWYLYIWCFL